MEARKMRKLLRKLGDALWKFLGLDDVFPQKEDPQPAEDLPWGSWDNVTWLDGSEPCGHWPATMKLKSFNRHAHWAYDGAPPVWASRRINDNMCVGTIILFMQHDGKWYAQPTEFFTQGQTMQATKIFRSQVGAQTQPGLPATSAIACLTRKWCAAALLVLMSTA